MEKMSKHLQYIDDLSLSPLLLACCITSHDYRNAFTILREQGCIELTNQSFRYGDTSGINTGLEEQDEKTLLLNTYINIGEYLAMVGGHLGCHKFLEEIFFQVVELKNRHVKAL